MKEKSTRLYLRVSSQEKEKIDGLAKSCGLSTAEYIRRRALGYMPKKSVPDSFYGFSASLSELLNRRRLKSGRRRRNGKYRILACQVPIEGCD